MEYLTERLPEFDAAKEAFQQVRRVLNQRMEASHEDYPQVDRLQPQFRRAREPADWEHLLLHQPAGWYMLRGNRRHSRCVLFATTCKRTVWCMTLQRVEGRVFELLTNVNFERSTKPISALAGELALPLPVEVHRLDIVFRRTADPQQLSFFARSRASYKKSSRAAREEC